MDRREFLLGTAAVLASPAAGAASSWPHPQAWSALSKAVGGRLIRVKSPFAAAAADPGGAAAKNLFHTVTNPYAIGDDVALTQTLGWAGAWVSTPSPYAVAAESAADVAAAVKFARTHNVRLAVKGGGHSYLGTSNAANSLLIWTRRMHDIEVHDAFVPAGATAAPQPAVSLGAGAIWMQAYTAVTTQAGRYVQGGGCTTVGVAGLVQGGGFGSFSKLFGTAAASLLEAEIVTADGQIRIANAAQNPDLFWALRGGGGGTFGVITRLTLRTHTLPGIFGAVQADVHAHSDAAYRRLVAHTLSFYSDVLMTPHWGEQIGFGSGNRMEIRMVFQGMDGAAATATWQPFFDWIKARPADYALSPPIVLPVPARHFWDPAVLGKVPGLVVTDDRPGAPPGNIFWHGDGEQVGQYLHAYQSLWLPRTLLAADAFDGFGDALFAASRTRHIGLHFNKGLAGGAPEAIAATAATATNPVVLDAFALAIAGGLEPPAYPGIKGHEPDLAAARADQAATITAMGHLRRLVPQPGAYVSETDFFDADWRQANWGAHYERLSAVKHRYDPDNLFRVHHGVEA